MAVAARELERHTEAQPDEQLREDARLIRAEIDRCRRILDAMAGQSGDSLGESPRPVSISDVMAEVRARLRPADANRLKVDASETIRVVWPVQVVARAVGNLAQNALHASTDSVSVRAELSQDGLVHLAVMDTGTGMDATQLSRAGEPFFTTKPAGAGTGLGLFVTRSSVEQLGGRLSLVSVPGKGTTATITLPSDVLGFTAEGAHG
jgi:two-component system sensor histidine kinase RegB